MSGALGRGAKPGPARPGSGDALVASSSTGARVAPRPTTPIAEVLRLAKSGIVDPSVNPAAESLTSFQAQTSIRSLVQHASSGRPVVAGAVRRSTPSRPRGDGLAATDVFAPPQRTPPVLGGVATAALASTLPVAPDNLPYKPRPPPSRIAAPRDATAVSRPPSEHKKAGPNQAEGLVNVKEVKGSQQQGVSKTSGLESNQGYASAVSDRPHDPKRIESGSKGGRHFDYKTAVMMGYRFDDDSEEEEAEVRALVGAGTSRSADSRSQSANTSRSDSREGKSARESTEATSPTEDASHVALMAEIENEMNMIYGQDDLDSDSDGAIVDETPSRSVGDPPRAKPSDRRLGAADEPQPEAEVTGGWMPKSMSLMEDLKRIEKVIKDRVRRDAKPSTNGAEASARGVVPNRVKPDSITCLYSRHFVDQMLELQQQPQHASSRPTSQKPQIPLNQITAADFKGRNILALHWVSLAKLTGLKSIDLSDNRLGDPLDPNCDEELANAPNDFCTFHSPDPRTVSLFSGWRSLTYLSLAGNNIEDTSVFATCTNLTALNLSSNSITTIRGLSGLRMLTELWISSNQIESLEDPTLAAKQAGALGTSHRRCGLPDSLRLLVISGNKLRSLASLASLTKLRILDVSENLLGTDSKQEQGDETKDGCRASEERTVWRHLRGMSDLEELNLAHNALRTISFSPEVAKSLKCLILANNQIESLTSGASPIAMPSLVDLDLSCNRLGPNVYSEVAAMGLVNLAMLDLAGNPCTQELISSTSGAPEQACIGALEGLSSLNDLTLMRIPRDELETDDGDRSSLGDPDIVDDEDSLPVGSASQRERIEILRRSSHYRTDVLRRLPELTYLDGVHRNFDRADNDDDDGVVSQTRSLLDPGMKDKIDGGPKLPKKESKTEDDFVAKLKQQREQAELIISQVRRDLASRIEAVKRHTHTSTQSTEMTQDTRKRTERGSEGGVWKQRKGSAKFKTVDIPQTVPNAQTELNQANLSPPSDEVEIDPTDDSRTNGKEILPTRLPSLISMFGSELGLDVEETIRTDLAVMEATKADSPDTVLEKAAQQKQTGPPAHSSVSRLAAKRRLALDAIDSEFDMLHSIGLNSVRVPSRNGSATLRRIADPEPLNQMPPAQPSMESGAPTTPPPGFDARSIQGEPSQAPVQTKERAGGPSEYGNEEPVAESNEKSDANATVGAVGPNHPAHVRLDDDNEAPLIREDNGSNDEADALDDAEDVADIVSGLLTASAALFASNSTQPARKASVTTKVPPLDLNAVNAQPSEGTHPSVSSSAVIQAAAVDAASSLLRPLSARRPKAAQNAATILAALPHTLDPLETISARGATCQVPAPSHASESKDLLTLTLQSTNGQPEDIAAKQEPKVPPPESETRPADMAADHTTTPPLSVPEEAEKTMLHEVQSSSQQEVDTKSQDTDLIIRIPTGSSLLARPSTPRQRVMQSFANEKPGQSLDASHAGIAELPNVGLTVNPLAIGTSALAFRIPQSLLRAGDIAGPGRPPSARRSSVNAVDNIKGVHLVAPSVDETPTASNAVPTAMAPQPRGISKSHALSNRKTLNKSIR